MYPYDALVLGTYINYSASSASYRGLAPTHFLFRHKNKALSFPMEKQTMKAKPNILPHFAALFSDGAKISLMTKTLQHIFPGQFRC